MGDDLLGTNAVAKRLRTSVATVNRWAGNPAESPLTPAMTIDGDKRAAAHLYRSADVEELWQRRIGNALERGACDACTTWTVVAWHNGDPCPNAEAVA